MGSFVLVSTGWKSSSQKYDYGKQPRRYMSVTLCRYLLGAIVSGIFWETVGIVYQIGMIVKCDGVHGKLSSFLSFKEGNDMNVP